MIAKTYNPSRHQGHALNQRRKEDPMLQALMTEFLENLAITLADYAQCKA
ncbi:hypothetical protein [Herbaspirillum sp. B65]|nr:hypothetical protein [Herbaspirillum sp. B65]